MRDVHALHLDLETARELVQNVGSGGRREREHDARAAGAACGGLGLGGMGMGFAGRCCLIEVLNGVIEHIYIYIHTHTYPSTQLHPQQRTCAAGPVHVLLHGGGYVQIHHVREGGDVDPAGGHLIDLGGLFGFGL